VPPGPPVLQTLVAEIYGPTAETRLALASRVKQIFLQTDGVVDVDWYVEEPQATVHLRVDRTKAALHGVSADTIARTIRTAVTGVRVDLLHQPLDREDVDLVLELPRPAAAGPRTCSPCRLRADHDDPGQAGARPLVPLGELVTLKTPSANGTSTARTCVRSSMSQVMSPARSPARPTRFSR
jgi:multidrug efflux pump subunit AcrB